MGIDLVDGAHGRIYGGRARGQRRMIGECISSGFRAKKYAFTESGDIRGARLA